MNMKTNDTKARKITKLVGFILSAIIAESASGYLYTRGISPVWTAVAIVCFPGFFRFIYKIASILIAGLILFAIISLLVF